MKRLVREKPAIRKGIAVTLPFWLHPNEERSFVARFNFNEDGSLREVFARPFKTGAHLEGHLDKFCMAVSRALKFGDTIENIWACLDDGAPVDGQDIFTALVRGAVQSEREMLAEMAASAGRLTT